VKSAVESVSPTRVKLTVEVPFDELKPSLAAAYKKIAGQVRIAGFRPGKVPPPIIDQRVGRGHVIEEAVNDAIPRFYGDAVRDNDVKVVGQPHVDITELGDGSPLVFTAEVDVRPDITLPAYDGIAVAVDPAEVTDEQLDEQLDALRDRFATLAPVDRPAATGDYVSLDLDSTVDGEPLPGISAKGISYEVGDASLLPGLDDAIVGLAAGASTTFRTELVGGEHAGKTADVTVTVDSVKAKDLPALDDEFAQMASEFDTLDELRADMRERLGRVRRLEQGGQARDRVLEALLAQTDVPLPDSVVENETSWRRDSMTQQLASIGVGLDDYLASGQQSRAEFDAELEKSARDTVKAQFVLDAIAAREEIGISEAELSEHIVLRARRAGVAPQEYANQLTSAGQLGALLAEVLRSKALSLVLERATVTDTSGAPVDLSELESRDPAASDDADAETATDADAETATGADADDAGAGRGEPAEAR
jgi:trigger factor